MTKLHTILFLFSFMSAVSGCHSSDDVRWTTFDSGPDAGSMFADAFMEDAGIDETVNVILPPTTPGDGDGDVEMMDAEIPVKDDAAVIPDAEVEDAEVIEEDSGMFGDGDGDVDPPCDDYDDDGLCDMDDPCPLDPENDADGDGVCEVLDPCPLDFLDDSDGDGVCD